jgi:predicted short-subunit dehydrogenase-like oxidoreductase (DUF2520 family)
MQKSAGQKIAIIGCGNVAWHLAKQFTQLKRFSIVVYNHQSNPNLKDFRNILKCRTEIGLNDIAEDADFYFICVSDKFITAVSKKIRCLDPKALIVHTSGSADISEIKSPSKNIGVFYPLQTFSKMDAIDWKEAPIILQANNKNSKQILTGLAKQFSDQIFYLDGKDRLQLHLAAVLVNNFTNALYSAANDHIQQTLQGVNFSILLPLIKQTTLKLDRLSPKAAQTGPAKRNDKLVIKKHLQLMNKKSGLKKIYKALSELIVKQQTHA